MAAAGRDSATAAGCSIGEYMCATRSVVEIDELVEYVASECGTDLSKYRRSCLRRRVGLRMTSVGCSDLEGYLEFLQSHPEEMKQLLDVVTIHVTDFFRDRDVFDALYNKVFPEIIGEKLIENMNRIRIWSAGCSTGEETYSIAVLLLELLRKEHIVLNPKIFGTDISEEACSFARRGIYADRRVCGIPGRLAKRYFDLDGSTCSVVQHVKRHIKFLVHDIFSKPPFSMLDLIVCRNVLIHFNHQARDTVLTNFHSVMNPGGILILGKSEAIMGPELRMFELIDARNKIYQKIT
jgi:chemotaxis methyl-accepting protein methylase